MKLLKLSLVASLVTSAACSSILFENPQQDQAATQTSESWHHVWLFDLYEGSKPVNLEAKCGEKGWKSVQTETSFMNGFAETFTSPIWHPETVQVTCGK